MKDIAISDVVHRDDLYPRIQTSVETVQKYADDLDVLPPIEINQHNELIDGWHRLTAHKKMEVPSIPAIITQTTNEVHFLELAIERNAIHGLQLSQADKKNMAREIYHRTHDRDRKEKKKELARILSVSDRTIAEWLSRIDKDAKQARNKRIFDLWMACYTQEEIADRENVTQSVVSDNLSEMADLPKSINSAKGAAEHITDFEPPIYNIWKEQERQKQTDHFGNTHLRWLDNLLYLYTKPYDIVVDPFAGGGSTIDICKKRFRRYWVSDRKPIVELEKEIRQHDVTDGIPRLPSWKDVKLVYLDPPYWKQAEGEYSNNPEDLANMSLDDFNKSLASIIKDFADKLTDAYIALIIQPTQWRSPDRKYVDHVMDMCRTVNLPVDMRYSTPYESQQYNAQMVDWAKDNKKCLVLTREIVVWKIS